MSEGTGPVVAVGAVARRASADGLGTEMLLVRRGHGPAAGTWAIPGGRVEAGETLHEAVVREVAEETGLAVVVDEFLGWAERIVELPGRDTPGHYVILDFTVTPLEPDAEPTAGDDAAEAAWVLLSDVRERRLAPGLADFLGDVGVLET